MTKFAFIVSGSGVFSGTENNELTLALLVVSQLGGIVEIFAPDEECDLISPFGDNSTITSKGNILYESAKITRGNVKNLKLLNVSNFDYLVLPGGYGVVKNLSNINVLLSEDKENREININRLVKEAIIAFHNAKKSIFSMCIAPLLVASIIHNCKITLGSLDNVPKNYPIKLNCIDCRADEFCFDENNLVYSTPAFMSTNDLGLMYKGIYSGIEKMISEVK